MATRNSYANDPVAGDVLTAANFRKLPGGWIALDEATGTVSTSGTTELTLNTISTPVDANRKLRVTWHCPRIGTSVNGDEFFVRLYFEGGMFGRIMVNRPDQTQDDGMSFCGTVNTSSAGNSTIEARAQRSSGTGILTLTPGSGFPMFLLVEDMGPST